MTNNMITSPTGEVLKTAKKKLAKEEKDYTFKELSTKEQVKLFKHITPVGNTIAIIPQPINPYYKIENEETGQPKWIKKIDEVLKQEEADSWRKGAIVASLGMDAPVGFDKIKIGDSVIVREDVRNRLYWEEKEGYMIVIINFHDIVAIVK